VFTRVAGNHHLLLVVRPFGNSTPDELKPTGDRIGDNKWIGTDVQQFDVKMTDFFSAVAAHTVPAQNGTDPFRHTEDQEMPSARLVTSTLAIVACLFVGQVIAQDARFFAVLPKTTRLTIDGPLDEVMVDGIDRFALRELAASVKSREAKWNRDYSSHAAYAKSIAGNREWFRTYIGAVDPREVSDRFELINPLGQGPAVGTGNGVTYYAVRWNVLHGVTAEGLLLQPKGEVRARVVALPDADWTPEMFAGLAKGVAPQAQVARRLAENGCQVLIPTLISRSDEFSGHPDVRYTNQTHREFVYRMAFQMGRHVIGYEVQKVQAAVDLFERDAKRTKTDLPIGVCGVGEGGLLAMYATAVDTRIDACLVSGYFQTREGVWEEPIYRNVWRLASEFGDAGIASLIAPRSLTVEACAVPNIAGPPMARPGRSSGAAPGIIRTAAVENVAKEFARAKMHFDKLKAASHITLAKSDNGTGYAGSKSAVAAFLRGLDVDGDLQPLGKAPQAGGQAIDAKSRQQRQFDQLVDFTQALLHRSARVRDGFWSKADRSSPAAWEKSAVAYRDYVWDEVIGRLPKSTMPLNPRTRKVIDEKTHVGYEVVLDVYPDVIASGILLLPKDLKPGERRPVVVCQHGLEGISMDTITTDPKNRAWRAYKGFSTKLVERGFIVYAPQNPYRGQDRFRTLQRKSNPMGRSLFSYILQQHDRTIDWLSTLPNVDAKRIGFYGLSYGGKTAVRVPPLLTRYALSICSADFNEWIRKNVTNTDRYSYLFTGEYEMFEWNMGHVANYAELSNLMTPRPFMVERGHDDGVAPDEWVAWEYAKVRRHYDKLGIGDKTEIEFFIGPHTINGQGTYDFLHRHLKWPKNRTGSE
jgi:dienelactone hydrolase